MGEEQNLEAGGNRERERENEVRAEMEREVESGSSEEFVWSKYANFGL